MTVARTEQRVMGFGTFKVEDGVAERSWTQMIGEAAAGEGEAMAIASKRLRTARIVHIFSCRVLGMDVFRRILML